MTTISSVPVKGAYTAFKSRVANDFVLKNARRITPFVLGAIEKFKLLELGEQELKSKISIEVIASFQEFTHEAYVELKVAIEDYVYVYIQRLRSNSSNHTATIQTNSH